MGGSVRGIGKRVWLTTIGAKLQVTKTEPVSIGLNVEVTAHQLAGRILLDGVWVNGERSMTHTSSWTAKSDITAQPNRVRSPHFNA